MEEQAKIASQCATPLVDSHLDLAHNVTKSGRDLTLTAVEIRALENKASKQAMVSLPELERGGIAVAFATVDGGFPGDDDPASPEQAEANALRQIELYKRWQAEGRVRLIKSVADLDQHLELWWQDRRPGLVMLMEGADPIIQVADLPDWWRRGVRIIALAWADTKYGRGVGVGDKNSGQPGLTPDGQALLRSMAEIGFIWDVTHLAEEGVRQGLDMQFPRVCASHANARAITPTARHLSDVVIREIGKRDGVIGVVLYNGFLDPQWKEDKSRPVTLECARLHAEHIAGLIGWDHVGIGSDFDGGFGLEETPAEIDTAADLYRVGSVMPADARDGVLGGNWLRFLRRALPRPSWEFRVES